MQLLDTNYLEISFNPEKSLFIHRWKSNTTHMKLPDFQEAILQIMRTLQQYNPDFILFDSREFAFSIPPEGQEWLGKLIAENLYTTKTRKQAILRTEHFFAQVSLEQFFDQNAHYPFKNEFFSSEKEAMAWLLQT